MKPVNYDFLEKCTKEELITAIRQSGWIRQSFRYSDILFARWQIKSEELIKRRDLNKLPSKAEAKKQDQLARQFNAATDTRKRLEILEKMKPYANKMKKHWVEYEKINKEEDKLDKLYESIDIQRQKET